MDPNRVTVGDLRYSVAFVRDDIERASDGSEIRTPATVYTRRAYVECQTGRERFASQQTIAEGDWQVVCRYFAGPTVSDRIEADGRTLQITAIVPDPRKRWVEFRCREING